MRQPKAKRTQALDRSNEDRKVYGYIRVSTVDQADSGAGLEAQRRAIISECQRNGWELVEMIEDAGISGKNMRRPGLSRALEGLADGTANVLMTAKLDRLSRSTRDVCEVADMALHNGWNLICLDAKIDTTTPHGRAQLSMMATFAQLEREMIGLRTREGLAVKKSQGVKLGRPGMIPLEVVEAIHGMRDQGLTLQAIADRLNSDGVATPKAGSKWYPTSVKVVLERDRVPVAA